MSINEGLFSSDTPEWSTPQDFYDDLDRSYGPFTLDPCSTSENAKCPTYYTKDDDGLSKDWSNETVYMNPPYGREIGAWVKKASETKGGKVVCLLPARTDTKWFHQYIYENPRATIHFIKGRLKFGGSKNSAPFPSMVIVFREETHH